MAPAGADVEAPALGGALLRCEASHAAMAQEEESTSEEDLEDDNRGLLMLKRRHANDLTPEQAEERRRRQEWVKSAVREAKSMEEVLEIAGTYVEAEWLFAVDEIGGDMYRVAAFGGVRFGTLCDTYSNARVLGLLAIFVIQLVGPPAIAYHYKDLFYMWGHSASSRLGDLKEAKGFTISSADWRQLGPAKFLGVMFVFCFILHCLFHLSAEANGWNAVHRFTRILDKKRGKCEMLLYLGAFMNCWVVCWCCVDAFIVMGTADDVKELLFDALGLTFLFRLDDVGGDFTFIEGKSWPGKNLGWLVQNLSEASTTPASRSVTFMFQVVKILLVPAVWALPILFAITSFEAPAS